MRSKAKPAAAKRTSLKKTPARKIPPKKVTPTDKHPKNSTPKNTNPRKTTQKKISPKKISRKTMQQAMIRSLPLRLKGKAELFLPAVPGLVDHYVEGFSEGWKALGRPFTPKDTDYFRHVLSQTLRQAFEESPYSSVHVIYETDDPPKATISWKMGIRHSSLADEYAMWVAERPPPLFGHHPDAKVMNVARSLGPPSEIAVLDVGAGTGRNTIPLAKEGFRADAVELTAPLANILRQAAETQHLPIRVYEGDVFDPSSSVPPNHYRLVLLAEVVSHFRNSQQLRALFETANRLLVPGGLLLFSAFLPTRGYEPDEVAREMSQVMWSSLFTFRELQDAAGGLPFDMISDESVLDYERSHLPAEQWPPTGWFEGWAAGQDVFDLPRGECPIEVRWLTFRKRPT
jgi:2-polyprenyl-3-methyl-5-hydroxy-6-metoxy-1,4-benzoquinol methylase